MQRPCRQLRLREADIERHRQLIQERGLLAGPVVIDSLTCAGNPTYESLARKGEAMTAAALATCAYDQIDEARTELEHPS
jgi:hypothetical protein